jgi:hypothetical protein
VLGLRHPLPRKQLDFQVGRLSYRIRLAVLSTLVLELELLLDSGPRDLYIEDLAVAAEMARCCLKPGDGSELMGFGRVWAVDLFVGLSAA